MGRTNKPWFRTSQQSWYATINGKMTSLGKDKEEAFRKFHSLKAMLPKLTDDSLLVVYDELLQWVKKNRSSGNFRYYKEHAEQFRDFLDGEKKRDIRCDELTVAFFDVDLETAYTLSP